MDSDNQKAKQSGEAFSIEKIIDQYELIRPQYEKYEKKLKILIEDFLKDSGISFDLIESRTKTVDSFREKITRADKQYVNPLEEITDKVGIRIVLYYLSDVEKVCEIINNNFKIDKEESIDKGRELKPNEFGYRSVHEIISIDNIRCKLPEWKIFDQFKAEIQVRTVLQHAWASIDHALRYKREQDAPSELRRRLFRLSGLLELADEEFSLIKIEQSRISVNARLAIRQGGKDLEINALTIEQYISDSKVIQDVILFAKDKGIRISQGSESISGIINFCNFVNIKTIYELNQSVEQIRGDYNKFIKLFIEVLGNVIKKYSYAEPIILLWILYYIYVDKLTEFLISIKISEVTAKRITGYYLDIRSRMFENQS
jgi:putative GTP pyrophosphokinase